MVSEYVVGPPRASAQYAASRSVCRGWNPWLKAWLTISSAITRECHASARRSRPLRLPAASYTLCMVKGYQAHRTDTMAKRQGPRGTRLEVRMLARNTLSLLQKLR